MFPGVLPDMHTVHSLLRIIAASSLGLSDMTSAPLDDIHVMHAKQQEKVRQTCSLVIYFLMAG